MDVSSLDAFRATPERSKTLDFAASGAAFKQTLQSAQESNGPIAESASTASQRPSQVPGEGQGIAGRRFNHNGRDVSFEELPADVQTWFREADEKSSRTEAYRAKVANDPNVGPLAKLRPFDPELDGWAMKRLAAMDPSTATMTPEDYYNYMGSDREKYATLVAKAEAPAYDYRNRIFGADLEQESKVDFIRDLKAKAQPLPATYGELERKWASREHEKYGALIQKAESPAPAGSNSISGADLEEASKVELIRDLKAQGQDLPATYGDFEQAWLGDLVRQQALAQQRQHLLGMDRQLQG